MGVPTRVGMLKSSKKFDRKDSNKTMQIFHVVVA
jgi:hypothetical protein